MPSPAEIRENGKKHLPANKDLFKKLKKADTRDLDDTMQELHEEVFAETDCLACGNCCRTTSPIFRPGDIDRVARHLKIRPSELMDKYLKVDSDGDYVLKSSPCPFLGIDNYCSVYSSRPTACREYPHTDRKKFYQLFDLTLQNSLICPAVQGILDRLRST